MEIDEKSNLNLTPEQKSILPFIAETLNEVLQPKHLPPDWSEAKEARFWQWLKDGTLREFVNDVGNVRPPTTPMMTIAEWDRLVREYMEKNGEGA